MARRNGKNKGQRTHFLFWKITPLTARRLGNFRANRRGYWSLWIFLILFFFSLFADVIANDRPIVVYYKGSIYMPVFKDYAETTFGGDFPTSPDYRDPFIRESIAKDGWSIWPLIPYSYGTIVKDLGRPSPTPPTWKNWLGTDDQARDVMARVIYGFRVSVLFGLALTFFSAIVGVILGALQGYFGGWVDLLMQRFIEVWESIPRLFLLIILSAFIVPNFFWLLGILLLFSWLAIVGVVRAEFLRARNFDYVKAARALGARDFTIMFRHVLPNAMVATITIMPFVLSGAIVALTSLDFLGLGLPPGSASLGELLRQGKANLNAPWLGITAFVILALMLSLLVFIGEAVRDAFDPRKSSATAGATAAVREVDPEERGAAPALQTNDARPATQEGGKA